MVYFFSFCLFSVFVCLPVLFYVLPVGVVSSHFAVAAPTTWNSLPLHIRNSSSIFGFRRQLKTFLNNLSFDPF